MVGRSPNVALSSGVAPTKAPPSRNTAFFLSHLDAYFLRIIDLPQRMPQPDPQDDAEKPLAEASHRLALHVGRRGCRYQGRRRIANGQGSPAGPSGTPRSQVRQSVAKVWRRS